MTALEVFVSFGTDHHPFDRLSDWVERWARANPDANVIVQHGASRPPAGCTHHDFLGGEDIVAAFGRADVVVVSAGPGGVMDARGVGRRPVAVPRRKGEAVDGHQVAFARHADRNGLAFSAESEQELVRLLGRARTDPTEFRCEPTPDTPPAAAEAFAAIVDRLVLGP